MALRSYSRKNKYSRNTTRKTTSSSGEYTRKSLRNKDEEENQLEKTVSNYKRRFEESGLEEETDTRNPLEKLLNLPEDQNFLFDIFEIIGRPQQALFGAIDAAQKGEDIGEGALKGLSGEKKTSAGQLLRNAGIGDDDNGPAEFTDPSTWGVDDVLGTILDIFADPVDIAFLPVSGTAKVAVNVADNARNIGKAADTARGVRLASKAGESTDLARAVTGLNNVRDVSIPVRGGRTTLLNEAGRLAGRGAKATARGADRAISWGLGKLDDARINNIARNATQQGIDVTEQVLQSARNTGLLNSYNDLKKSVRNTFDYAKALPNNLVNKARNIQGRTNFATTRARAVLQEANRNLDDYVYNTLRSQNVDLSDLDNYFRTTKNGDIDSYLNKIRKSSNFEAIAADPNSLYNTLYNAKNQASLDVRDLIESGMDTSINGATVLSNLGKRGKDGVFTGTKESVDNIARYLDNNGITYEYKVNPQGLGYDLSIGKDRNNLRNFRNLQNSQEAIDAFSNMNLNKELGYTAEELSRIQNLQANPELQTLADSVNTNYSDLARIYEQELGVDFSGITDRAGYVRRSLADGYTPFDNVANGTGRGNVNTQAFSSRRYTTPSLVTERLRSGDMPQVGEAVRSKGGTGANIGLNEQQVTIKNIDREINKTRSELYDVRKENLTQQRDQLIEKIKSKQNPSQTELNLEKSIRVAAEREQKIINQINEARSSLTDSIIKKAQENPNAPVTKSLITKSQKYGQYNKEYNDFLKSFNKKFKKPGTYTEKQFNAALNKLDKLNQKRLSASYDVAIAANKLDGSIDDSVRSVLKNTDNTFNKVDDLQKALNDTTTRKTLLSAREELARSSRQEMNRSLSLKLQNIETQLKNLDNIDDARRAADDAKLLERIKTLQETKDVLMSKEGSKLFNDNYISGMDNFINYASKNASGAKLYNEALLNGTFYDDSLVRVSQDALTSDLLPRSMTKLKAEQISQMKAQLQSVRGILPNNTKAIDDLIAYLGTNNVYMDKNLVNLFNFGTKADVKPILKLVNGFNNIFKKFSVFTPGFHLRNITGNATNLVLSGIPTSQIPNLYKRAAQILDDDNVLDLMRKANAGTLTAAEQTQFNLLRQFVDNGFYRAGTGVQDLGEIVSRAYNTTEEPLTEFGRLSEAVGGTTLDRVKANTINRATDFSAKMNDKMDSLNRMAALIYGNEHPNYYRRLGFDNVADAVRYTLFDPSNMSPTEQNVIKKIIPFYTFTKQNMIYQVTNLAKNSSRYHQLIKAFDNVYDSLDEDSYRDYQKEGFQLPLPFKDEKGNTIMLKMNLPVSDLTIFSSPKDVAQRVVSSTTPLIRAPFEQVSGIDMYTGQELYRSGVEQLASYLGISNITTNLWDKIEAIIQQNNGDINSTEMWTEIFNSLAQYNNSEKIKNSRLYEEMEYYSNLVSQLRKQGIEVPTIRELDSSGRRTLRRTTRNRNKRNNSN